MKKAYKLYIDGDQSGFDREMAGIALQWVGNIRVFDDIMMQRLLRKLP